MDPTRPYTADELAAAFVRAYPLEKYRRMDGLFAPDGPEAAAIALAGVQPAEFLAAAAFRALSPEVSISHEDV